VGHQAKNSDTEEFGGTLHRLKLNSAAVARKRLDLAGLTEAPIGQPGRRRHAVLTPHLGPGEVTAKDPDHKAHQLLAVVGLHLDRVGEVPGAFGPSAWVRGHARGESAIAQPDDRLGTCFRSDTRLRTVVDHPGQYRARTRLTVSLKRIGADGGVGGAGRAVSKRQGSESRIIESA